MQLTSPIKEQEAVSYHVLRNGSFCSSLRTMEKTPTSAWVSGEDLLGMPRLAEALMSGQKPLLASAETFAGPLGPNPTTVTAQSQAGFLSHQPHCERSPRSTHADVSTFPSAALCRSQNEGMTQCAQCLPLPRWVKSRQRGWGWGGGEPGVLEHSTHCSRLCSELSPHVASHHSLDLKMFKAGMSH